MSTMTAREVWQAALGELQLQVSRANYETWLKDTMGVSYEDGLFVIGTPTAFASEWLQKRLRSLIRKTLMGITGHHLEVRLIVLQPQRNGDGAELPLDRLGAGPAPPEMEGLPGNGHTEAPRFNPRYTFGTFVVGNGNRLAHAAAAGVAERPGQGYNPLFIYGGVGLGKTHLLHAIGHICLERNSNTLYVTSEQFTNDFINAIRERKNEEFRQKYRRVDLLLIDDVQFIGGKEQTQEEFFHTFNELHRANRQVVITSDRPPRAMPLLEDRLRSRFEGGLIADIQPPDLETRLAILRAKVEESQISIPQEVLELVAQVVQDNIRDLEGSLNRVLVFARSHRAKLTPDLAKGILVDVQPKNNRRRNPNPKRIIGLVADYYGLDAEELKGKRRDKEIALARQVAMYLIREEAQRSFAEVGQILGGRDHSTILHGCEKISKGMSADGELRREIMELREKLHTKH